MPLQQQSKLWIPFLLLQILSVKNYSNAIVINKVQSRRASLSSIATTVAILGGGSDIAHASSLQDDSNIMASPSSAMVVPGTGMKPQLRNVIVGDEDGNEWKPQQSFITQLAKSRINAMELSPLSSSLVPFANDNELFYDPFLFGSWDVTTTLKRKTYPYGTQYLPSSSLYEGSPRNRMEIPGDSTSFELHYFSSSTAAVGNKNDETIVDLSQATNQLKIIADRAYNAKSMNTAYKQLSQIENVVWDYQKDPTRLTLQFSTLGEDMQPLGERRGEVYFNARKSESARDDEMNQVFCSSERIRSVLLVPGDVVVSDTETITEYRVINGSNGDHVKATSRIAVYLTPNPNSREGLLWQSVGGKAVAFFDYDITMRRKLLGSKPFVSSPKGTTQVSQ